MKNIEIGRKRNYRDTKIYCKESAGLERVLGKTKHKDTSPFSFILNVGCKQNENMRDKEAKSGKFISSYKFTSSQQLRNTEVFANPFPSHRLIAIQKSPVGWAAAALTVEQEGK